MENITEVLANTNYGRCVYKMDNDVVDHQTVNLQFEDGVTASFQMVGFTNKQTREIRVMGTKGEIWGDFKSRKLYYQRFGGEEQTVDLDALCTDFTGHGGGDERLVYDVVRFTRGDDFDTTSMTTVDRSAESHYLAFAAEHSRVLGGQLVDVAAFKKEIGA